MSNGIPSSQAQAWMNGTYVILTLMTRRAPRFDQLGGTIKTPESSQVTRTILANSWDIHNADGLRATLVRLRDTGDRAGRAANANDGLGPRGLLAWDFVQLMAVAGWGYMADFITEAEAWSFMGPAAIQLQQTYQSWEDLGQAYTGGVFAWSAEAGPDCQLKVQQLMADSSSPWRTLPWKVDLGTWAPGAAGSPHNLAAGTFDLGGGQQLRVKVNGKSPEDYLKDKASSMIWGWVIGGIIALVAIVGVGGLGVYIWYTAKNPPKPGAMAADAPAGKWDGKSTFECSGNDKVTLTGITATVSGTAIKAGGNCQLTLTGVNVTGAVGIDATMNAKVSVTGGSITGTTNSIVASMGANVTCTGTKVTGKSKTSMNAKIVGAN